MWSMIDTELPEPIEARVTDQLEKLSLQSAMVGGQLVMCQRLTNACVHSVTGFMVCTGILAIGWRDGWASEVAVAVSGSACVVALALALLGAHGQRQAIWHLEEFLREAKSLTSEELGDDENY